MLFSLLVFVLILFRWSILERFIGTVRMYLFDAILGTFLAAMNFGQPSPWPWLGYFVAILCTWWAISSGRNYLKYDALQRKENGQGKSDAKSVK